MNSLHPWDQAKCPDYWGDLISGVNLYYKAYFGTFQSGRIQGWPEYRGGHISGVLIRGSSLYRAAMGLSMKLKPMHAINTSPSLVFLGHTHTHTHTLAYSLGELLIISQLVPYPWICMMPVRFVPIQKCASNGLDPLLILGERGDGGTGRGEKEMEEGEW